MGTINRVFGIDQSWWNFLETDPIQPREPVLDDLFFDESSTNELVVFLFEYRGMSIRYEIAGQFQAIQGGATIKSVASQNEGAVTSSTKLFIDGQLAESQVFDPALPSRVVQVDPRNLESLSLLYSGDDVFYGSPDPNQSDSDGMNGYAGDDRFYGYGDGQYEDKLFGGDGLDTAVYRGPKANYQIQKVDSLWDPVREVADLIGYYIVDSTGLDGDDSLYQVERLEFTDTKVAIDMDGSAGKAVKLLGAVFGAESVSNKAYVGLGLQLLDGGLSFEELASLAVGAAGARTSSEVCTLLWTNLIGSAPRAEDIAPFVSLLDSKEFSVGQLTALAAESAANLQNINFVGLVQTGVEYS